METNLKIIGVSRKSENGNIIDNKGFDLSYDGNYADINTFVNDKNDYIRLNNDELIDLLNKPVSRETLENRLMSDFNISPSKILSLTSRYFPNSTTRRSKSKSKTTYTKQRPSSRLTKKISSKKNKSSSIYNYSYPFNTLNKLEIPKLSIERLLPSQFKKSKVSSSTREVLHPRSTSRRLSSKSLNKSSNKLSSKTKKLSSKTKKLSSKRTSSKRNSRNSIRNTRNNIISKPLLSNILSNKPSKYMSDLLSPTKSIIKTPSELLYKATPYVKEGSEKISQLFNQPQEQPYQRYQMTQGPEYQYQSQQKFQPQFSENKYMNDSYLPYTSQKR